MGEVPRSVDRRSFLKVGACLGVVGTAGCTWPRIIVDTETVGGGTIDTYEFEASAGERTNVEFSLGNPHGARRREPIIGIRTTDDERIIRQLYGEKSLLEYTFRDEPEEGLEIFVKNVRGNSYAIRGEIESGPDGPDRRESTSYIVNHEFQNPRERRSFRVFDLLRNDELMVTAEVAQGGELVFDVQIEDVVNDRIMKEANGDRVKFNLVIDDSFPPEETLPNGDSCLVHFDTDVPNFIGETYADLRLALRVSRGHNH